MQSIRPSQTSLPRHGEQLRPECRMVARGPGGSRYGVLDPKRSTAGRSKACAMWLSPVSTPTRTLHRETTADASPSVVRPTRSATGRASGDEVGSAPRIRSAAARSEGPPSSTTPTPRRSRTRSISNDHRSSNQCL